MAQDKIRMPSSGAGITRYFDDYRSKIEFKPGHIVILLAIVIIIELSLHSGLIKLGLYVPRNRSADDEAGHEAHGHKAGRDS
jgi:preprotein translocase subunit Sec61beta